MNATIEPMGSVNTDVKSAPPATVVIPCWNASAWIERAIRSALDQSIKGVEVIVVDDGSTDASVDIVRSFEPRVTLISDPNRGASSARNRGLSKARAKFVMFLDADDYIEPNSLACWLDDASDADVVLGPYVGEANGIRTARLAPSTSDPRALLTDWQNGRFVPTCAVLWRRSFVQSIGAWTEGLLINDDGELIVRAVLRGARIAVAHDGLGIYVQHEHPYRVSRRRGREVLESELCSFRRLVSLLPREDVELRATFGHFFYSIAYKAFLDGLNHVGSEALNDARWLGFKGHRGSKAHVLLSRLIGLRLKMRLANAMRGKR
jgi:glycosyltransferase involved in cell wall biosynthesis